MEDDMKEFRFLSKADKTIGINSKILTPYGLGIVRDIKTPTITVSTGSGVYQLDESDVTGPLEVS